MAQHTFIHPVTGAILPIEQQEAVLAKVREIDQQEAFQASGFVDPNAHRNTQGGLLSIGGVPNPGFLSFEQFIENQGNLTDFTQEQGFTQTEVRQPNPVVPTPPPPPAQAALPSLTPAPPAPAPVPQRSTFEAPLTPGPGTGFQVDPRDSEKVLASLAQFVNAMFGAQQPGLISGSFTNPNQVSDPLQNLFTNSNIDPAQFQQFMNQLSGFGTGNPLGDALSQQLLGGLGQGGTDPFQNAAGQQSSLQDVINTLLGQPAIQSVSAGRASDLFQNLATQGGGTGSDLQSFLEQQLRSSIAGGGINEQTAQAQRDRFLRPALEARAGLNNRQGGGVASLDSPLFQELNRRTEQEFLQDQLIQSNQNLQSQFGQAGQLGQQQFGNLFGVGQAQGQLGQTSQQINQQAIGLGGQLQDMLSQQGLQSTQLGLGREQFQGEFGQQNLTQALQFLQLMNLFGLGQTDIASSLTRQLLGGAQIANPKGSFLNALVGGISTGVSAIPGAG